MDLSIVNPKPKPVKIIKKKKSKRSGKEAQRRRLEKAADALCKQIVLLRDGFCVCPAPKNGHGDVMQAGHLISRTKESVQFDLRNVNIQCNSCNLLHEHQPERYTRWYIERYGAGEYTALVSDSTNVSKMTLEEYQKLCEQLSDILQLQKDNKAFIPRFSQKQIMTGEWRKSL